ncbi:DUF305 domain-containing protein [Gordonia sp. LSe1-13]|uniref:DUF305 domain-containing protein n=1 Tax=Gordonia sesuvii TaxID=3116777 RepID=A0ABU7MA08_9ACTN|nr:DUF305 domain-containing protein [Gordonia sp. LSe1-13]
MKRQIFACSTVVAVALLGACSADDEPAASSSGPAVSTTSLSLESSADSPQAETHNDADIAFNQMMIPHHMQALMMADLVPERTSTPAVRDLADRIRAGQQPEIDEMSARLREWGVADASTSDPSTSGGHMSDDGGHGDHMSPDGHDMAGMMTPAEMAALSAARGAEFDRLWLEGMIAHHEGAVEMADTELADGIHEPSRELATRIKATQQDEIEEMNSILAER